MYRQQSLHLFQKNLLMASNASRRIRIYTRTGDKGTSALYTGERRSKTDPIFSTLGDTDELNALIGIAREHCLQVGEKETIKNTSMHFLRNSKIKIQKFCDSNK